MTRPIEVEVETDTGERWERQPFFAVAAGTIQELGLGFRPFHRANEIRGSFHLLGIQTNAMGFVTELGRIHRAEAMSPGKYTDALVRRATVRGTGPMRYMIDGDLFEHPTNEGTLRIGPVVRIATMH